MAIVRWNPPVEVGRQEAFVLKRCQKKRRLFAFLRENRHQIFDDEFQQELEVMYRDTGLRRRPKCDPIPAVCEIHSAVGGTADGDEFGGGIVIQ